MGVPETYVCFSSIKSSISVSCYGEQRCCCYDDSYHGYPSCCSCTTYWWLWALVGLFVLATGASILAMYLRRRKRVHGSRSGSDILFGDRHAFQEKYAPKLEQKDMKVERIEKLPQKMYVPPSQQKFIPPSAQQQRYVPLPQNQNYLPPPQQQRFVTPPPQNNRFQPPTDQRYAPSPQYLLPQDQKQVQYMNENKDLGYKKEDANDKQYGKFEQRETGHLFAKGSENERVEKRED